MIHASGPGIPCAVSCGAVLLTMVACGGGGSGGPGAGSGQPQAGMAAAGAQYRGAAALLVADPARPGGPGKAPPLKAELRDEWAATGAGMLRFLCLESGAGVDPTWSPFAAELAAAPGGPGDLNNNGTPNDDALSALRQRYVTLTGFPVPTGLAHSFALPEFIPTRLQSTPTGRDDYANLRLVAQAGAGRSLSIASLGDLILATSRIAGALLAESSGTTLGRTPERGMVGLLLLEKALAAERFVLGELAFDGAALGGFDNPFGYLPATRPRLLPARVGFRLPAGGGELPARPEGWTVLDGGSRLLDQAALLRGFAELAWLSGSPLRNQNLTGLFEGRPFGGGGGNSATGSEVSWERDVRPILHANCLGCHSGSAPNNGFSVETYASVLRGGDHRDLHPSVVAGRGRFSLLWRVLGGNVSGVADRMPKGGPYLSAAERDTILKWIDGGAPEQRDGTSSAIPGWDGMRVVVRNLAALHLDPIGGALVDLVVLSGGPQRGDRVEAESAGEVLLALAAVAQVDRHFPEVGALLRRHASFVVNNLIAADGRVHAGYSLARKRVEGGFATLPAASAVFAGLFAAEFVQPGIGIGRTAERVAEQVRSEVFASGNVPKSGVTYTPRELGRLLDGFANWYAVTPSNTVAADYRRIYELTTRAGIQLAEWPATGETFGDGNPDTDGDGILEVGSDGRPPMFAPTVRTR